MLYSLLFGLYHKLPQIARFMGPTWGPSGADRTQVGPMLAPWTLLSGSIRFMCYIHLYLPGNTTNVWNVEIAMWYIASQMIGPVMKIFYLVQRLNWTEYVSYQHILEADFNTSHWYRINYNAPYIFIVINTCQIQCLLFKNSVCGWVYVAINFIV